ncbi:hypothetical protein ACFSBG_14000 [Georgenia yuyongxinii]|uniref:hypothetical protein n=1 Tax=Georgenia yuyongxinii TaxID=2589797 RepID=UPI0022AA6C4F|nr:hypothetical protein [Georgenia yuyongxinii]
MAVAQVLEFFEREVAATRVGSGGVAQVEVLGVAAVGVFRMGGVRTSILGRPRPLSGDRRTAPHYTLNCEEPPKWHTGTPLLYFKAEYCGWSTAEISAAPSGPRGAPRRRSPLPPDVPRSAR